MPILPAFWQAPTANEAHQAKSWQSLRAPSYRNSPAGVKLPYLSKAKNCHGPRIAGHPGDEERLFVATPRSNCAYRHLTARVSRIENGERVPISRGSAKPVSVTSRVYSFSVRSFAPS